MAGKKRGPPKGPPTKLFNIRITVDLHKRFKAYCEKKDVSMGSVLLNYIQSLVDGQTEQPINQPEVHRRKAEWKDPLDAVRNQYKEGRDF
jgi:hypothetical protein